MLTAASSPHLFIAYSGSLAKQSLDAVSFTVFPKRLQLDGATTIILF